jgi:hypothetical protein
VNTQEIIKDIVRIAVAENLNDAEEVDREALSQHTYALKEKYGISSDQLEALTEEALTLEGWHEATSEILSDEVDNLFYQFPADDIVDQVLARYASEHLKEDLIELRERVNKWFEEAIARQEVSDE